MVWIILWTIAVAIESLWVSFRKKSLDVWKLSNTMFKYFAFIFWFLAIGILYLIFWIDFWILTDYKFLLILLIVDTLLVIATYLQLYVLKRAKLSDVLPYENLDKIFVIIIWSILYYWTEKETSLLTLILTIITILVIILFTIDIKKLKIPKYIGLFSLFKLINSIVIVSIWYVLLTYSNITVLAVNWIYDLIIFTLIALLLKDSFKSLFNQSKSFYKNRLLSTIFWWTYDIIGLYIIQTSGLIIATLLWFMSVVFWIISMKFILNDKPSHKQILLSFIVICLIGSWLYFK
jgi:hypothetical protein